MAGGRWETRRPQGNGGAEKRITEDVRRTFRAGLGVRSALAEKFLRCARRAQARNSLDLPPWKTTPAFVSGAPTLIGRVRTNDAAYYMAVSETGGVAGATPPTHASGASPSDGAIQWSYLGGTEALADDPAAPVLTFSNSPPGAPLTNFVNPTVFPEKFTVLGAYAELYQGAWMRPYSYQYNPNGERGAYGQSIAFKTNAPNFSIRMNTNGKFRIVISDRYHSMNVIVPALDMNNNDGWFNLLFGNGKDRRWRRIEIESNVPAGPYFGGIRMTEMDCVEADDREVIRSFWYGDSQFAGSGYHGILPGGSVPWIASKKLGWEDAWNISRGSTGVLNPGGIPPGTGTDYTYRQRLAETLPRKPEVINVQLSTNDLGLYTSEAHAAEVGAFLTQVRASTDVPVLFWGFLSDNASVPTFEAAVKAVIAARNDPQIKFTSLWSPPGKFPFMSGNWNNTSNPPYVLPFSESHKLIRSPDGVHLSEIGARMYGEWIGMNTQAMIDAGELG